MLTLVQINFRFDVDEETLERVSNPDYAAGIAAVPGLIWKVFIRDPATRRSGGIYLFADRAAADAYVMGPIIGRMRAQPVASDMTIIVSQVREDVSRITRAPLP